MALAVGDGLSATDRPWHTGHRRSLAMAWARTAGDRDGWLRPAPPMTNAATTTAASASPGPIRRIIGVLVRTRTPAPPATVSTAPDGARLPPGPGDGFWAPIVPQNRDDWCREPRGRRPRESCGGL